MINIAELLKDAPRDLKLYSPICGHCKLSCILYDDGIRVIAHDVPFRFDKYGRFCSADDAECLLFPSKGRTWEGWKLHVEPKFKDGDKVVFDTLNETIAVVLINEQRYLCESCREILFDEQDKWHLAPKPHYDIANFYAGMPVLVRADYACRWDYSVFSRITGNEDWKFAVCNGVSFTQCIPFEGNEHLLGTTDMCDEKYINW